MLKKSFFFLEQRYWRKKRIEKLHKRAKAEKNIFLRHKPHGLFAFCHWKFWTFLEFPDFLDILKKKNLMFNSRIISDHLCFCFLWVICVLWKLRNRFFFSSSPCCLGHTMDRLSSSLWKEWNRRAREAQSVLTFLASASEVKTVTREKNIFSSKPKKRTFLLVLAHSSSQCWPLSELPSVPSIGHICTWNHFCELFLPPRPDYRKGDVSSDSSERA